MNDNEIGILEYEEHYIIACHLCRVKPEVMLQGFIDRVCFATFKSGTDNVLEKAANGVVAAFLEAGNDHVYIPKYYRSTHRRCAKKLNAILNHPDLSDQDKREQLNYVLGWCRTEILKTDFQISKVELEMAEYVDLTSNFMVLCFMYGIFPERLLEYFMYHISLAKYTAGNQFHIECYNPFMTFFLAVSDQHFKYSKELKNAGYDNLIIELNTIMDGMKVEESVEERTAKLAGFYSKWFYVIRKVPW